MAGFILAIIFGVLWQNTKDKYDKLKIVCKPEVVAEVESSIDKENPFFVTIMNTYPNVGGLNFMNI
jgi:hypothetical protein